LGRLLLLLGRRLRLHLLLRLRLRLVRGYALGFELLRGLVDRLLLLLLLLPGDLVQLLVVGVRGAAVEADGAQQWPVGARPEAVGEQVVSLPGGGRLRQLSVVLLTE